ncbi:hypothetical protein RD110_15610 [Rhodoferax koreense]|uniref:Portal protein n=1 Tax=Rhodoferax koreensis TaxID=1842727 RepID=A0A1P8JXG6_9BURK|nr:hypothetical protein RD110_15610 [Rhodoferax koreense]
MKPYDDRAGDTSRDSASGGYSLYALERMLHDCGGQPLWRDRADLCAAYYDGKQLSPKQEQQCIAEGLDLRATNLIRPVINSVLGQEAKSRTDVSVQADDDSYTDVAEVIGAKLKEAERETSAHMAVSNAYASMVKTGIGWVHVSRNADPLAYPYNVEDVHRNEIWWDWHGQKGNTLLNGCRWLVRKRMIDLDEITAAMPEFKGVLERAVSGWDSLIAEGYFVGEPDQMLVDALDRERRFRVARQDWVDTARKQVKMYEVWYRVPASVVVLTLASGKKVEYDPKDQRHNEAISRGLVQVTKGVTSQVRMALFAGPHRLIDIGTKKRVFPYFPFFAFREDGDKSPYGLIDGMISPQDEYNERRLRIQWMLKAKQVFVEEDALATQYNTIADLAESVMRPDLVAVLSKTRTNPNGGLTVKNELSMQPEQFTVMGDAKQLIQDTAGRYGSQLGSAQVQSGVANSILVEQGEQSMGEMNDNYVFARRSVFECLKEDIAADHQQPNLQVPLGSGRTRRIIVLNAWDRQTNQPVNTVKDADVRTALAEVPSTPAFRGQQQQQLATIIQALAGNPKAVAILAPAYLESSNLNNRQQIADDLRKAEGLPVPGDKAGAEAAEQQQMAAAQKAQMAQEAIGLANVQGAQAKARLTAAQAGEIEQRVQSGVEANETRANTAKLITDAQLNQTKSVEIEAALANPVDHAALIKEALHEAIA